MEVVGSMEMIGVIDEDDDDVDESMCSMAKVENYEPNAIEHWLDVVVPLHLDVYGLRARNWIRSGGPSSSLRLSKKIGVGKRR